MPTPNHPPRPDPVKSSREEWLKYLAVDPQIGLSGREADRRRDTTRTQPLFSTTEKSFSRCLLTVLREPILWILLVVSVIALLFDRVPLGLVCLALVAVHLLLCAILLRRAERLNATMQKAYDAPLPRVLRSGRVTRVGADAVVPGDILLLCPGDLVPADCRLLSSRELTVSERELDASDPDRPARTLEKNADALPEDNPSLRLSPANMVYAGALVESGFATAVAIAIGDLTHLGGLVGSIRPSHGIRPSETRRVTSRLSSLFSLCLTILIIPIVAIGIFTLRDRYELLDIFLSAVSLAVLGLGEHTLARYAGITAAIRRDAATLRNTVDAADIRGDSDAERLCTMTDLLLLGSAALHDGKPHPEELWVSDRSEKRPTFTNYCCTRPDADGDARQAIELLFLWHYGRAALPMTADREHRLEQEVGTMLPTLSEWADIDTEALLLRFKDIEPVGGGGVRAIIPTPEGNRRLTVVVSEQYAHGEPRLADAAEGFSALYISTVDDRFGGDDAETLHAMLTYTPRVSPKTEGWIKSMEVAGIRVVSLLPDVSEANTRILAACGFCDHHAPVRPEASPRRLAAIMGEGIRAFEGCTDDEIAEGIRDLQASGRVVGVLSVDARDISHLNAADIAITCSPSLFTYAESDFLRPIEEPSVASDGATASQRADDLSRRRADVIVRRASGGGGGLGGVRTAILASDRMRTVLDAVSGYLFLASVMRLVFVLLSGIFGILPIPAPLLLVSGFWVDAVVLLALRSIPTASTPAPRRSMTEKLEKPWLTRKIELICLSATAALPWLVALVARMAGAGIDKGTASYAMLSMVALQMSLYITIRPRRDKRHTDRTDAINLLWLGLIYIGVLAAALGTGLHPLYALLVPPIPALLYIAASAVTAGLTGRRRI